MCSSAVPWIPLSTTQALSRLTFSGTRWDRQGCNSGPASDWRNSTSHLHHAIGEIPWAWRTANFHLYIKTCTLKNSLLPLTLHQTSICLIPKQDKDPTLSGSLRLVALLNVDYKIIYYRYIGTCHPLDFLTENSLDTNLNGKG